MSASLQHPEAWPVRPVSAVMQSFRHMLARALPVAAQGTAAVLLSTVFGLLLLALTDAPPTWVILILLSVAALGTLAWSRDLKTTLLVGFLFTLPIEISKALTSVASAYSPAFSIFLSDLSFYPLLVFWCFDLLAVSKRQPLWSSTHSVAALFGAWMLFEAWLSHAPSSPYIFINDLKHLAYFIVVADLVVDRRVLKIALLAIAAGLAVQLLMAMAQFVTGSDLQIRGSKNTELGRLLVFEEAGGVHFRRLSGFLPHPNVFACYLTIALPPFVALLLLGKRTLRAAWWPCLVLVTVSFVALVMALSRGAWIAFAFSMLFVVAAGLWSGLVRTRQLAAVALSGMLAVSGIVTVFPAAIYRITNSDQRSSDSRRAMIDQALLIISEHPIAGVGLAGYNGAAQTIIPTSFAGLLPAFRDNLLKGVVHNKYLLTFAELGLVGVTFLLLLLWRLVVLPFKTKQWRSPFEYALSIGLSAAVAGQAIFFLFDHFSYDVRMSLLYTTGGLAIGLVASSPAHAAASRPVPQGRPSLLDPVRPNATPDPVASPDLA